MSIKDLSKEWRIKFLFNKNDLVAQVLRDSSSWVIAMLIKALTAIESNRRMNESEIFLVGSDGGQRKYPRRREL